MEKWRGNEVEKNLKKSRNSLFQNIYLLIRARAFFDNIVCVLLYFFKLFAHTWFKCTFTCSLNVYLNTALR